MAVEDEESIAGVGVPLTEEQVRALPDAEFGELLSMMWREQAHREVMRQAAAEAEGLAARYLEARDGGAAQSVPLPPGPGPDGQPVVDPTQPTVALSDIAVWVQPTGAHDAYPQGYPVQHGGRVWRSRVPANVWEPGQDGPVPTWEDITGLSTIIRAPETDWRGDPIDHNLPTTGGDDGRPDVDVDPDPTPAVPEWREGASYKVGDVVSYQGGRYRCVGAHTTWAGTGWTPDVTPAMWKRMED